MSRIVGIVLAGGASRRMGRPKALLPFAGRGAAASQAPPIPFVDAVLAMLAAAGVSERLVVLGHEPDVIRAGAGLVGARIVINAEHALGQFSSLRAGIAALPAGVDAAIVALVDQPHVPAPVVAGLIARFVETGAPIVRPVYGGRGGHPLLLAAETFPALLALPPTRTTFDLVSRFAARRADVPVESAAILEDFDTPEDLERLR